MMKFLRSQSQTVLIIFLGVMGLGFLFYGNSGNLLTSQGGARVSNDYGRIYGEDLSVAELYGAIRDTRNAMILGGHAEELNQAGGRAQLAQDAWSQLLLLREADRLHIQISDQELIDYIHNTPAFQKDGVYSPEAYEKQMAQIQVVLRLQADPGADPLAGAKAIFETYLRNTLVSQAVYQALFSSVRGSLGELAAQYDKYYGPCEVNVITFDPHTIASTIQPSPEDIAAEYKAHPLNPNYRSKEKRNIDYVVWTLTPDQAKLPPKEKAAALEDLGEKALDFALAFQPEPTANGATPPPMPDFFAEAKKRGLTPATTGFFTVDTPPAGLPPSTSFNNAAFDLSKDNVISKVVQMDNAVAVLHLAEIQPSDLLPLDQVKGDIAKMLNATQAIEAEKAVAQVAAAQLKGVAGKTDDFKAKAASMKLSVETLPNFIPMKASGTDPRLQLIAYVASTLSPGQVSDIIPDKETGNLIIVQLDSRAKADPAGLDEFITQYGAKQNQQLRSMVIVDWVNWSSKQPGTHRPPGLDGYGGVE